MQGAANKWNMVCSNLLHILRQHRHVLYINMAEKGGKIWLSIGMYAIASMCHHVVLLHVSISLLTLPSIWRLPFSMLAKKVISPNIATCAVLPTLPLFIRTLTHEVNESSDHENWMQIPLQVWILFPWKRPWWVWFGMVLNDPKEDQAQNTMEKNLGYEDQKSETASSPARHFVIVAFAVPAMKTVWIWLEIGLNSKMVWWWLIIICAYENEATAFRET